MEIEETTGLALKIERIARRVTGRRLAAALGVHPSRVSAIEREGFVSDAQAARYRAALATCAPSTTSEVA